MSLFDRVAGVVPGRVRRLMLLADAALRIGPAWIAFRLRYAVEQRTGLIVRRSRVHSWPALEPCPHGLPNIVATTTLKSWLQNNVDNDRRVQLLGKVAALNERRFDVFGTEVVPNDWHHDPYAEVHYPPDAHWSRVGEFAETDIKRIWEPSRFGWAFDIARAHLIEPRSGAADLFWEVLEEWCDQNPPNSGVNWACGQEASIRLMAVVAASSAMHDSATEEQASAVQRLAWVTAERVEANIGYARSQRNNHHASEAVGLLTTSLLFPGHLKTHSWRKLGERHLQEVCEKLVFADGGTSQYSTNYHRVFVHNFVWAVQCYRTAGVPVPRWLSDALGRSSRFLTALVEPISGSGPFFGPDDSARLLPLSVDGHRNLGADSILAQACVRSDLSEESDGEASAWFGLDDSTLSAYTDRSDDPWLDSFPEMGIHILGCGDTRAYVTGRTYKFRPTQDDQLHCDIWMNGIDVAFDAGTQSYHPRSGEAGALDLGAHHNGPRPLDEELLPKVGRFMWARWPTTETRFDLDGTTASGLVRTSATSGANVERRIRVRARHVQVLDRSSREVVTRWATRVCEVAVSGASTDEQVVGFSSNAYGRETEIACREITSCGDLESRLTLDG